MKRHRIIQTVDPSPYEKTICAFWDKYLPGTSHERLSWMTKGNPSGPAVWLLALQENSKTLSGVLSITPKYFFGGGKSFRAGIVGDFMVLPEDRAFGPAMELLRSASISSLDHGFDFLYTLPNEKALKLVLRCGFEPLEPLECLINPVSFKPYFDRFLPNTVSRPLSLIVKYFRDKAYVKFDKLGNGIFEEVVKFDDSFDVLWAKLRRRAGSSLVADRSSVYLRWRYFQGPFQGFRILTYRKHNNAYLSGYLVFRTIGNSLDIVDIASVEEGGARMLLMKVNELANTEGRQRIYFLLPKKKHLLSSAKRMGFMETEAKVIPLLAFTSKSSIPPLWTFIQGDRNC